MQVKGIAGEFARLKDGGAKLVIRFPNAADGKAAYDIPEGATVYLSLSLEPSEPGVVRVGSPRDRIMRLTREIEDALMEMDGAEGSAVTIESEPEAALFEEEA
jgi:hypothetical protein